MGEQGQSWYVYMVECADGTLYTGIATDPVRRMREHLSGAAPGARYTRSHPPVALAGLWETDSRASASKAEWQLKQVSRAEKERLLALPAELALLVGADAPYEPIPAHVRAEIWAEACAG